MNLEQHISENSEQYLQNVAKEMRKTAEHKSWKRFITKGNIVMLTGILCAIMALSMNAYSIFAKADEVAWVVGGQNTTQQDGNTDNGQSKADQSQQAVSQQSSGNGSVGDGNTYPYPQCTWWASERYHQLTGVYVPWRGDAWMWVDGAQSSGWSVASQPKVGDIVVLQRGVQGVNATYGHVGIVEGVNDDGSIEMSSMNWGADPTQVAHTTITPGGGVSFLHR